MSELLIQYFQRNIENYKQHQQKNADRMAELLKASQEMQVEYNNLQASNNYINSLLEEIDKLPKQEVNNATTENVQGS
jgi:allophanate hydrolase subunit 1